MHTIMIIALTMLTAALVALPVGVLTEGRYDKISNAAFTVFVMSILSIVACGLIYLWHIALNG